jgi:hypothetical protein
MSDDAASPLAPPLAPPPAPSLGPSSQPDDQAARIDQLLTAGLDEYFAGRYDGAVQVWSRVFFLDRSNARARAYIERARRALAERQRESEELLEGGFAALRRGDHREARRLLQDAVAGGAASDDGRAALGRLDRVDVEAAAPAVIDAPGPARRDVRPPLFRYKPHGASRSGLLLAVAVVVAGSIWLLVPDVGVWPMVPDGPTTTAPVVPPVASVVPDLPLRAETALTRARMLAAGGRLHDAMAALDPIRPTDPQKGEADRLRADLQRRLIALTVPDDSVPVERGAGDLVP